MFNIPGIRNPSSIVFASLFAITPIGCDEPQEDELLEESEAEEVDPGKSDGAAYLQLGGIKYYPVTTLGCSNCGPAHDETYEKSLNSGSYGHYYYADVHRDYRFSAIVCSQDFHPIAYLQYPNGKIVPMQPYEAVDATHCTRLDDYGPTLGRHRILLRSGDGNIGTYTVDYFNEINRN